MHVSELSTPALVVDLDALDHNIDTMASARPGPRTRPHVKAFKSTALARHVAERGSHRSFCCATLKEMEGLVAAGLDDDLLLANETLDAERLATSGAIFEDLIEGQSMSEQIANRDEANPGSHQMSCECMPHAVR